MNNKVVLTSILLGILSGCSSIISKSEYSVAIKSNPDGASFTVTNRAGQQVHNAVTPSTVTLKSSSGYFKSEKYTVVFNKAGYSQRTFTMESTLDGWYFGNILFGGLLGMLIIDPATGAMYNLPDSVDITMNPQHSSIHSPRGLTIAAIDSLTKEQLARLEEITY